jgi:hypothetical protein
MGELARSVRLIMNHTAEKMGLEAQMITMTVEQRVKDRLNAGVSLENIRAELQDELRRQIAGEATRIWGPFVNNTKRLVYEAEQNGRISGMVEALRTEDPETLYRWQTNGTNICEDCQKRHGELDTLEGWKMRGLPTEWGSRCGENCQCTLVAEDLVMEPILVGQE